MFGHHRAACPEAGVLEKSSFPRARRSASLQGGRRSGLLEHVRPRHGPGNFQRAGRAQAGDRGGRSDIVARSPVGHRHDDGVSSQEGWDGQAKSCKPRRCRSGGVARRRKEATFPELSGENGRARLVVLAAEVGARWNSETAQFITALADARAQEVPLVLQGRAQAAWGRRWSAILACTAARAFCVSSLDCRPPGGTGEAIPSVHEVMKRFSERTRQDMINIAQIKTVVLGWNLGMWCYATRVSSNLIIGVVGLVRRRNETLL